MSGLLGGLGLGPRKSWRELAREAVEAECDGAAAELLAQACTRLVEDDPEHRTVKRRHVRGLFHAARRAGWSVGDVL